MKRRVDLDRIRRRLPPGRALPTDFDRFAKAAAAGKNGDSIYFDVSFTDANGLTHEALAARLLPFLRLGDGGVVALWYRDAGEPPIVHVDSEGGHRLVAADFDDLLLRLRLGRTGVEDLDGVNGSTGSPAHGISLQTRAKKPGSLATLAAALRRAVATSEPRPDASVDGEKVRRELVRATASLVAKGQFAPYHARDYWSLRFQANKKRGGAWQIAPQNEALERSWPLLLAMTKDPKRSRYEIAITKGGLVSIDGDRQLLLVDAKEDAKKEAAKALSSRAAPIRKAIVDATAKMVAQGHYLSPLKMWIVALRASKHGGRWRIEERRGRTWGPSSHAVLEKSWPALLALTKDASRTNYTIKVLASGRVAIDEGRQLCLDP